MKSVRIRKAPLRHKSSHSNIDDTDSEDDTDDREATDTAWMDEWKSYLNMNEDIPDSMGIVRWWGVSTFIPFPCLSTSLTYDALAQWFPISHLVRIGP